MVELRSLWIGLRSDMYLYSSLIFIDLSCKNNTNPITYSQSFFSQDQKYVIILTYGISQGLDSIADCTYQHYETSAECLPVCSAKLVE